MPDIEITENLQVNIYDEATIVPRNFKSVQGLYDSCGKYVRYSGRRLYSSDEYLYGDKLNDNKIDRNDMSVYYLGDLRCHYGHFLIDEVTRLWGIWQMEDNVKIAYSLGGDPKEWMWDFLDYLGICKERLILVDKPMCFKRVFFAVPCYIVGKRVSALWKTVFDKEVEGYFRNGGVGQVVEASCI